MKKYGLLFLCLLALPVSAKTVNSRYTPVKNPDPQYFLTITGQVIGKSRGHFTLIAVYSTFNPQCDIKYHDFAGSSSSRERHIYYDINLSHPNFFLKIPLQYFLPGFCQWKLAGLERSQNKYSGSQTVFSVVNQTTITHQDTNISFKYQKHDWYQIHPKYLPVVVLDKNNYFTLTFYPMEKAR